MAGSISTDLAFFTGASTTSDCDSNTGWSGSPVPDTEVFVEGSAALSAKISKSTGIYMYALSGAVDLSDTLIFVWMNSSQPAGLTASSGLRIRISSNATATVDWGEWYVGGAGTYEGGWECFVVRTTTSFSNSSGSPNTASVLHVGVVCDQTASAAKTNFWFDAVRYGTQVTLYGGTDVAPASFADFLTAEASNAYGAFSQREGVLMCQAKVNIGSTSAGVDTYFKDTSKVVVFRDRAFGTFYELKGQGNSTGDTEIYFGESSGGQGISGCMFRSAGTSKFKFTMDDAYITNLGVYGCIFYDADTITFPEYSADKAVLNCSFEQCSPVVPDTCTVQYCNFISADSDGIILDDETLNLTDCNFINPTEHGVQVTISGELDFYDMLFYGTSGSGPYDVENTTAGILTINNFDSNTQYAENTGGGSTVFNTGVPLQITVKNITGSGITDAQCSIWKSDDDSQLMNEDSVAGVATENYNYPGSAVDIYWRVRKSSVGATRYLPQSGTGEIDDGGFSVVVTLRTEPIV